MLTLLRVQVQSVVRKLRTHKPNDSVNKKKKEKIPKLLKSIPPSTRKPQRDRKLFFYHFITNTEGLATVDV